MSKIHDAIVSIRSPNTVEVISKIEDSYDTRIATTGDWNSSAIVREHHHGVYAKIDTRYVAASEAIRNAVDDLKKIANAADDDITSLSNSINEIVEQFENKSELLTAFSRFCEVSNELLASEQSSHRRFEQLVQTLLAAQSEVKALYDTIDKAIEAATKTATSGALGLIEDKGKEISLAIEKKHGELQKHIETEASRKVSEICDAACSQFAQDVSAKSAEIEKQACQRLDVAVEESEKCAKDDLTRQTGDLLTSRQREFAEACSKLEKDTIESVGSSANDLCEKFRETVKQKLSELTASTVAEMERKLDQLCQNAVAQAQKSVCEKIDEIGQAETDKFSQSMTKLMEDRVAELSERTTSAVQQLNVDLQAQIPALFRTTDAPSTFGARLKWLLLGKV